MAKTEHTLIRVAEWLEWIPSEILAIGEDIDRQTGQVVKINAAMHNGLTGLKADESETLTELKTENTGRSKQLIIDSKPQTMALYLFQAVLAKNCTKIEYQERLNNQRLPIKEAEDEQEKQGRDKRGDLLIVDRIPDIPRPK